MNTKILLITLMAWGLCIHALSQATDTLKYTMQQCIDYAMTNNTSVQNATLDEEIAKAKVREVKGLGLPQITGNFGAQHNFKLRSLFLPGDSFFGPLDANGQPILSKDDILVSPNIFQLPSALDASLNASQLLFNASYLVGLKAAKTYKELAQKASQQTKEQTSVNVSKAYFLTVIAQERLKLFTLNITRLDSTLRQTRALQKQGFVEKIDLDRLEVSFNNLLTEYDKTRNLLLLSDLSLKYQMGMPLTQPLLATDKIDSYTADTTFLNTEKDFNINDRTEYQLLQTQKIASELDLKNNRSAALPTVVLSGSLGAFSQNNDLNFFQNKRYGINNSIQNKTPIGYWADYSFIQLGLSVPIFGGLQRVSKVQQSKLNVKKSENNLKNFESAAAMQLKSASVNARNSLKSLDMQKRNMELAKQISEVSLKKYKQGIGSNLELINSESSLKEAQINYYNALYEYLVYKTEFLQAMGKINSK
ncbi:MAG: TolC family protein [Cytophagales bacterium]|nr:TolC family protein [Cytophagales bacterium]